MAEQRDVAQGRSKMTEQFHRNSFWVTTLDNTAISPTVEYQVSKQSEDAGFVLFLFIHTLFTVIRA